MLRRLRIENLVLIREAELDFGPGLNAITGETGAGKTILAQSLGLLLGARGDASLIGPAGSEAYVEAELDLPSELGELDGLRPEDEQSLVLARRIFADGRTRAYAWGRTAAREDVGTAAERVLALSGQFQQRRLARPAFQLEVLDAFADNGAPRAELRTAWRELQAARRRQAELGDDAGRIDELRALVEDTEGFEPDTESALREACEKLRHVEELAAGAAAAAEALAPDEGEGAAGLAAQAERAVAPLERLAPELARAGDARTELAALAAGVDPATAAAEAVAAAQARADGLAAKLRARRKDAAPRFAAAVAAELAALGMGAGEFEAPLAGREPGATGADEVRFLIRPNPGLPLAPVAETASGGELSRIALAIAVVAGGETLVFDEIDAGIGGETANAVGRALARAGERAQVITITHLPQIASLAEAHFRVEKVPGDPTHTRIAPLSPEERPGELERMLGGAEFLETLKQ